MKIEIGPTYAQGVFEGTDYMYVTKNGSESGIVGDVFYENLDVVPKVHILYLEYLKVVYERYYEQKRKYDALDELAYQKQAEAEERSDRFQKERAEKRRKEDAEKPRKDETDGT